MFTLNKFVETVKSYCHLFYAIQHCVSLKKGLRDSPWESIEIVGVAELFHPAALCSTFFSCFCGQLELQTPKLPPQWSGEPRSEKREPRPRLLLKQRRRHSLLDKAQWCRPNQAVHDNVLSMFVFCIHRIYPRTKIIIQLQIKKK